MRDRFAAARTALAPETVVARARASSGGEPHEGVRDHPFFVWKDRSEIEHDAFVFDSGDDGRVAGAERELGVNGIAGNRDKAGGEGLLRRRAGADDRFSGRELGSNAGESFEENFGASADFGGSLADHGDGWNEIPALQERGAEGMFESLIYDFVDAERAKERVAAQAGYDFGLAGENAGLGTAHELIAAE